MFFDPAERIAGVLAPPPDKSISHRAALLGAMSDGDTRIDNYLRSDDTAATIAAVHELGAEVDLGEPRGSGVDVTIRGVGLRAAREIGHEIDVGNSGTLIRLLPGWLAGQPGGRWLLDGDASIRARPMDRIATPLAEMGARISCRSSRYAPIEIEGTELGGIEYELPVASAQVKSCVLLAGLMADGRTTVIESLPTRDHTERMLAGAGVSDGTASVLGVKGFRLGHVAVPGDFSSAAFFVVAATLVSGSELVLKDVGGNQTRTGLLDVMRRMGADVEGEFAAAAGGEPAGELTVRHAPLRATTVEAKEVPRLIDELPLVALLGAFADGVTTVRGASELRHKETDRIATVVEAMSSVGATIEATEDGFVVEGTGELAGGVVDSHGDHRLAMLGAVAGAASRDGVRVREFDAAAVSYPEFASDLAAVTV